MKHLLSLTQDDISLLEENCELLFENGSKINTEDTEVCVYVLVTHFARNLWKLYGCGLLTKLVSIVYCF